MRERGIAGVRRGVDEFREREPGGDRLSVITGVGTDLCMISRMKRAAESEYFVRRVFSKEEIDYARSHGEPSLHFASAFAAKEAFAKASGFGVFGVGLANSWVRRTKSGPVMMLNGEFRVKLGDIKCWLSLSHEGDYALAFVVLEKR